MSGFHTLMMAGTPVYSVTFDYGGIPEQRVLKKKQATRPADPYKENYYFTGWFVDGVLFDFNTQVAGNLVLTAGWNLKTFTVTFDANEGIGVSAQTVAYGNTATYVTSNRAYCNFMGWTLNGVPFDFNTPVTEDITLIAQWEKILITQSGSADVVLLASTQATVMSKVKVFGIVVVFPTSFTQIESAVVNGNITVPWDRYDCSNRDGHIAYHQSFMSNSGFDQTTGIYWKSLEGTTSGTLGWIAKGYMA